MNNSDEFNQMFRHTPTDKLEQLISSAQKFLDEISKEIDFIKEKADKQQYDKFMVNYQTVTKVLTHAECELFERKQRGEA